jgi:hypothetical protein
MNLNVEVLKTVAEGIKNRLRISLKMYAINSVLFDELIIPIIIHEGES